MTAFYFFIGQISSKIRIKKTVNSVLTSYTYEGDRIVMEQSGTKTKRFLYDEVGLLIGFSYEDESSSYARYFYIRDQLGHILGLVDGTGEVVVRYAYDAWGNILSVTGSAASTIGQENPFRYKGYYYDSETSYYYCQSRYYVPMWCRWLSSDKVSYLDPESINGINLYMYCVNNPVMYVDPSGDFAVFFLFLLAGAILGGITGGINAYNDGARGWNLIGKIAVGTLTGAILGAGVGLVVGLGGAYLVQGLITASGKLVEDLFAYSLFGTPIGTWEDYAIAFIAGGLTSKIGLVGKFVVDVIGRPFVTQLSKIGTGRQTDIQWSKLGYDIVTRAMTFGIPKTWKPFFRGVSRGCWDLYIGGVYDQNNVATIYVA